MAQELKTLYDIPVNRKLLWDHNWSDTDFQTEKFLKWYLARVISNGTARDLRHIGLQVIRKYLPGLVGVPRHIREFWQWYLPK